MANDSKLFAALAHGLGLLLPVIPALIIWLIKKDQDEVVNHAGKQAMNFQITMFIASFVAGILVIVIIGLLLLPVIGILYLVFTIIAIIKVVGDEEYSYPAWTAIRFFK